MSRQNQPESKRLVVTAAIHDSPIRTIHDSRFAIHRLSQKFNQLFSS